MLYKKGIGGSSVGYWFPQLSDIPDLYDTCEAGEGISILLVCRRTGCRIYHHLKMWRVFCRGKDRTPPHIHPVFTTKNS